MFRRQTFVFLKNVNLEYKDDVSFRLSSHNFAIETGHYRGIDRQNRLCEYCTMYALKVNIISF